MYEKEKSPLTISGDFKVVPRTRAHAFLSVFILVYYITDLL
jgi:hypothetical protein